MAGSIKVSGAVLQWARNSSGYSIDETAHKGGFSTDQIRAWESGTKWPTYKQLETLAEKVYKRSLALLLLQEVPVEDPVQKDFRNLTHSEKEELSPGIRIALRKAKRFQLILEEVNIDASAARIFEFKVNIEDNPHKAAMRFREFLFFDIAEQKKWRTEDSFNEFRRLVESLGVYVFQLKMPFDEARAFCLTGRFPLIVLNTDDSKNGRIFSLFHELCHILFNVNGIFRDAETGKLSREYRLIEDFCNTFASAFLVPESAFDNDLKQFTRGTSAEHIITSLAGLYNVSNEVIARKLLQRRLIPENRFWTLKRTWDQAARAAKQLQNAKMNEREVQGIAQDTKIISEKGKPYVEKVLSACKSGRITSAELLNYLETKSSHIDRLTKRLQ